MSKHTPTPWKTEFHGRAAYVSIYHPIGLPNETGWAHFPVQPYSHTEAAQANAAFIVRAVNSHDALVEALEALLDTGRHNDEGDFVLAHEPWDGKGEPPDVSDNLALIKARAALSQAKAPGEP